MSANVTTLSKTFNLTIASGTWLEIKCPTLSRWFWLQVDGATRLELGGNTSLTDGAAYSSGGMKVTVGQDVILPLPAANEAKSIWISGDGGATTGRIVTSLDRMSVT